MPTKTFEAIHRALPAVVGILLAASSATAAQLDDLQASYNFLVNERNVGGALLTINTGLLDPGNKLSNAVGAYLLPASFYDTPAYWGAYVCGGASSACAVHNTYNLVTYELIPQRGPAGRLQVERVNAHNGVNIYDAAAWQIAVVLGAVKGGLRQSSPTSAYALASGLTDVLFQSSLLQDANTAPGTKRAVTVGNSFIYSGAMIADGKRAYAFRTLAPEWIARDPLAASPYASWITASNLPVSNPAYESGRVTWTDWKPITGENAWAFLIGPLQAAHLHYIVDEKRAVVPFGDRAVQNALDILPTFATMQSAIGGVYYAPAGTIGNEGEATVNPHQISVENNFSLYAGLRILRATLMAHAGKSAGLGAEEQARVKAAVTLVDAMINGGNFSDGRRTKGLLSFFRTAAWQDGRFVQGGLADDPAQKLNWVPTLSPKAVDVDTWGIAALGTRQLDTWFGFGASYSLWERLKAYGGYGAGKRLWGVGYSDQDGNGRSPDGTYRQGVLSGEWTAGAVTAVRNMIAAYESVDRASPDFAAAQSYVAALKQDETSMLEALRLLRIDHYSSTDFPGKPSDYAKLLSLKTKPYLYASKRHYIPFGWYANPLPSTASTAWVIMLAYGYDPFGIGGQPN